ncbi:MAG: UDP-N-acetylglucosamine--N-acetylmuramyl-(pentapeptide) pyrophosphoryl-undecaprenol N-acetylglucosamine transferase, partial [bacterium]
MRKRILIVAGGTGGHIFPALALACEFRDLKMDVFWAGRKKSMEQVVALKHGFEFQSIRAGQIMGKKLLGKVKGLVELFLGFLDGWVLLNHLRPDALVATGGFVSAPLLLVAWLRRTRFYLFEQNRIPGRVVRIFSRYARQTFLTFPIQGRLPGPACVTGTPLRKELVIKASSAQHQKDWETVLVLGGSQGSRTLNLAALDMAAVLTNFHFIILTGRRDYQRIKSLVRSANCEIIAWTDHPEELYENATLAVTRGGGLVLSELLLFGIPAVIIPFPFAADKHQDANAAYLSSLGAAVVLEESRLDGIINLVRSVIEDKEKLMDL